MSAPLRRSTWVALPMRHRALRVVKSFDWLDVLVGLVIGAVLLIMLAFILGLLGARHEPSFPVPTFSDQQLDTK